MLSSPFPLQLGESDPPTWTYPDGVTIDISEMGKAEVERALATTRCELRALAEAVIWIASMPASMRESGDDARDLNVDSPRKLLHYIKWINWLELELTFLNLEGTDLSVELGESAPPIWLTKSGARIHLRDMHTRHIANAYRLIVKRHRELRITLSEAYSGPGPRGELAALELDQNIVRGEEECDQLGAWGGAMFRELCRRGIVAVLDRDPDEEEPLIEGESEEDYRIP